MGIFYRRVLKPILFQFSPDTVHNFFIAFGEFSGRFLFTRWLLGLFYNYKSKETPTPDKLTPRGEKCLLVGDADISKTVDGITYRTPILLSAGFDPDGQLIQILPSLSFGGEEVGSVTAQACVGNPRPHFTRLIRNKAIVVYKGLKNSGVDALIKKLRVRSKVTPRSKFVLGISIARTNSPSASADIETGILDYVDSFRKLNEAGIGDYYTINISCPNAHTGESFTDPACLAKLLPRLREIQCDKPVYLKMPINVPWEQFSELLAVADSNNIQGLVIGNSNKNYKDLKHPEDAPNEYRGGLSGSPCRELSTELIKKTREKYGTRFTIIGVGGILTPDDAMEKFSAGADLIQLISGMVFSGPGLIKEICERISETR